MGLVRSFQISAVFPHLTVLRERARRAAAQARHLLPVLALRAGAEQARRARRWSWSRPSASPPSPKPQAVELPYGRKRALEIATTLALEPEMMLLDEPMAGLGQEDIERIAALIRSRRQGPHRADGRAQPVRRRRPLRHASPCWPAARCWPRAPTPRCRSDPARHRGLCRDRRMALRRGPARRSRTSRPGTANRTSCTASTSRSAAASWSTLLGRNGAGQDHDAEVDHGHRRASARARSASTASETDRPAVRRDRAAAASPTARRSAASSRA